MKCQSLLAIALLLTILPVKPATVPTELFGKSNLAAWCIVPFDGKKRGPEERAAMLEKLGFTKFVYDYRKEHLPTFDAEMDALNKHHIDLIGWWFPGTLNPEAKLILDVIKRHGMKHCDLWVTGSGAPTKTPEEQAARVKQEVARLKPIALEAGKLGVRLGLYNHGAWFGEPENLVAMTQELKRKGVTNVGIVYNLHHAHEIIDRFPAELKLMLPYLICFNLNGMTAGGDKKGEMILPLAQGDLDLKLLKELVDSGYSGPIGILNHTNEDAEVRLRDNLDGLTWLVKKFENDDAGPRPTPKSWKPLTEASNPNSHISNSRLVPSINAAFGKALSGGLVVDGKAAYRTLPITIECRAKLDSAKHYNILVASDPKSSSQHWELYSHAGGGEFSVYLPGHGGDFKSKRNICDGTWHDLIANIEETGVRLYVDGKMVLEKSTGPATGSPKDGDLAFGQLVDGSIGCDGLIDDVRISRGVIKPRKGFAPRTASDITLGLWNFDVMPASIPPPMQPAAFEFDQAPLHTEDWPHWKDHVNRDRVYDFYTKEAIHFMKQKPPPELLPQYPGLDGGKYGHWGNQNDDVWCDARWNDTDIGNVMCGVFRGGGVTVVKGVCVRLGGKDDVSVCFDPLTASFPAVWKGGFIGFDPARHGFMGGVKMKGTIVSKMKPSDASEPIVYHGFYRHGHDVIFSFARDGKEFLCSPKVNADGHFSEDCFSAEKSPMRDALKGGPAQWPQWIGMKGTLGTAKPYALDTLPLPVKNPWKTLFFVTGSDFFKNGDAAICTMTGEVWLCRGIDESLQDLRWKRFATGLHQPLGLKIVNDEIYVLGRDQITHLHDLNGDDEADFYECVTNAQTTSPGGHDFITGLERDAEGRWYFASGNQGLCRVKPGGPVEVLATGFRNPNGMGLAPDGTITTSMQEGDWTPASAVCQIKLGAFYGHGGPKPGQTVEPPLIQLPRGVDNSCGGQCFTESEKWGPLGGQLIHFSSGAATHILLLREKIGDQWQAAGVPLPGDFLAGSQQGRINPKDGQFYVTGLNGWGTYAPDDGCFQRVRYTGGPAHLPVALETHDNGVLLTFSDPVDAKIAGDARNHFAQCWNYRYGAAYGSPEFSLRHPRVAGHDPLEIRSAHVLDGGKQLFLEIPQLQPANTIHLHIAVTNTIDREVYLTAHRLGAPFTDFPGYAKIAKIPPPSAAAASLTMPPPAKPNPWRAGKPGREIKLEAALGLHYATTRLEAKAGERISLTFRNPDVVPHNFVLLKPGRLQAVGDIANKMISDPGSPARHYVPETPDVLVYTDMVNPGASFTIHFDAPREPGDHPFMCTFPGHWLVMNGMMSVR